MRALLLAAGLVLAAVLLGPDAEAAKTRTKTTSVGISAREFTLTPFRRHVPVGRVRFNLTNYGEDDHDLVVLGPGSSGTRLGDLGVVDPGQTKTLTVSLRKPGVYRLICTLDDHLSRGMSSRVRVTKPKKK